MHLDFRAEKSFNIINISLLCFDIMVNTTKTFLTAVIFKGK